MVEITNNNSLLLFRVGPVLCCAPSLPIISIIHPPTLTRPPGSDSAKPGIFKHSGHIVSNLDLRFKFGVDKEQWEDPGRVIITQIEPGHVGFWVDEIREVLEIPASGWGNLPPLLPRGIFTKTLLLDKKIYLYAEFENLYKIPTSDYLRVYIEHLLKQQGLSKPDPEVTKQTTQSRATQLSQSLITDKNINTAIELNTEDNKTKTAKDGSHPLASSTTKLKATASTTPVSMTSKNESTAPKLTTPNTMGGDKTNSSLVIENQLDPETVSKKTNSLTGIQSSSENNKTSAIKQDTKKELLHTPSSKFNGLTEKVNPNRKNKNNDSKEQHRSSTHAKSSNGIQSSQHKKNTIQKTTYQQPIPTNLSGSKSNNELAHSPDKNISVNNKHNHIKSNNINEDHGNNHSITFAIIFLLLLITIPGLVWYLSSDSPDDTETRKIVKNDTKSKSITKSDSSASESDTNENNTLDLSSNSDTKNNQPDEISNNQNEISTSESPAKTQEETNTIDKFNNDVQANDRISDMASSNLALENNTNETPNSQAIDTPAYDQNKTNTTSSQQNETSDFHADIQSDNSGITIVLEVPEEASVFKHETTNPMTPEKPPIDESADDQNDKEIDIAITIDKNSTDEVTGGLNPDKTSSLSKVKTKSQPRPSNSISSTEIIHIVVKGDTLWHIAIRYVNNPYKYPELARLSNIKNPDLIYPGNRVRIIKKVRTKSKR